MENTPFHIVIDKFIKKELTFSEAKDFLNELKKNENSVANKTNTQANQSDSRSQLPGSQGIAVIGMAGQFPGANNIESFWKNLVAGHDGVAELPQAYLDKSLYVNGKRQAGKTNCKWGGVLEERDYFDPLFFSISPREAESMSPHQRLVLQEGWKAIEDAGYSPKQFSNDPVGVFIGAEPSEYFHESFTGASDAIVASRLSYFLNFQGPALVINTGCSSSAVAIHQACESLRTGESSLALAGGVYTKLDAATMVALSQIEMLSSSGRCLTFDASADGTIMSEGVGMIVLKLAEKAIADGDHIYGIIKASGINQDGASNGLTAPNGKAQEQLITRLYKRFNINPENISYAEAHGTGTKLGDPVEVNALTRAFKRFTDKTDFCHLGSAKSHIGHTSAAAGVVGLIKVLLSMKHGQIPGLLNFKKLNPIIDLSESAFIINTNTIDWAARNGQPLMAALNSFGHSGTNAHLVIEQYSAAATEFDAPDLKNKTKQLILLSAKSKEQLLLYAKRIQQHLIDNTENQRLENIAYTLHTGREAMEERVAFVVENLAELIKKLELFYDGADPDKYYYQSFEKRSKDITKQHASERNLKESLLLWFEKGDLIKIAELWTNGVHVPWTSFYKSTTLKRCSLPSYPFLKEIYRKPVTNGQNTLATEHIEVNERSIYKETVPSIISTIQNKRIQILTTQKNNEAGYPEKENRVKKLFVDIAAKLINVNSTDMDLDSDLTETGFDPVLLNALAIDLNEIFGLDLNPSLFLEYKTLHEVVSYCFEKYPNIITPVIASASDLQNQQVDFVRKEMSNHLHEKDELLCKILFAQLRSLGLFSEKENKLADLKQKSGISDRYRLWFEASLSMLEQRGYIQIHNQFVELLNDNIPPLDQLWLAWDHKKAAWLKNNHIKAQVILVEKTVKSLPEIITGKVPATDIMFPRASFELVEGIYKNNCIVDYFNKVLTNTVVAYLEERLQLDSSARIRIIEVGAGTGGTSSVLLKELKRFNHAIEEYCYTDISRAFLIQAEQKYLAENPFLTFKTFDVQASVATQDIAGNSFDIAVATNVLHATKNIRRSMSNIKSVLKTNGVLMINEMITNSLFAHLTFGLLDGWWLAEDTELRISGSPALSTEVWKKVLAEGFRHLYLPTENTHELGQQIFIAESDGEPGAHVNSVTPSYHQADKILSSVHSSSVAPSLNDNKLSLTGLSYNKEIRSYIKGIVKKSLSASLRIDVIKIDDDKSFADYGLDSILAINLVEELNKAFEISIETTRLFDYSSVSKLSDFILQEYGEKIYARIQPSIPTPSTNGQKTGEARKDDTPATLVKPHQPIIAPTIGNPKAVQKEDIAVIGMSGRFARSRNLDELWEHLAKGDDLMENVSRWDLSEYFPPNEFKENSFCKKGSFLTDLDKFDAQFFNISGVEAKYMDPQQRIILEESWNALEDAGYAGGKIEGSQCGVYFGCVTGDYYKIFENDRQAPPQSFWGNLGSVIPARISYYLNLQGPAVAIDTACSSSLVALHMACQSLWSGENKLALTGGIFLQCTPWLYLAGNQAGMLSPTGHCYTFDDRANGFVPGEGAGVVLLKRLSDAIADGDPIHGVIKGSGINQDGTTNGITAPSANSQERLEDYVYNTFNINPEHIQLVEAHGTGTKLGDPIEFSAITRAFRKRTGKNQYCAIGSIKTNLGHTQSAAGIAGFLKVLLALKHKQIPPSINFTKGNSFINFNESPFYVNTTLKEWEAAPGVKRCGVVSSFGVSGTNAHIVIEEAPAIESQFTKKPAYLFVLSARNSSQLKTQAEQLISYCHHESSSHAGNISFTLMTGRKKLNHRLACIAKNKQELIQHLNIWLRNEKTPNVFVNSTDDPDEHQNTLQRFGDFCLRSCIDFSDVPAYIENLSVVADVFTKGYLLDYNSLFQNDGYRIVSLPTYPFMRKEFWVTNATTNHTEKGMKTVAKNASIQSVTDTLDTIISTFQNQEDILAELEKFRNLKKATKELSLLGSLYLFKAFQHLGVFTTGDEQYSKTALKEKIQVAPAYVKLVEASLDILDSYKFISLTGNAITAGTERKKAAIESKKIDEKVKKFTAAFPEFENQVKFLITSVEAYPDVLTGKKNAMEILYPNGSMDQMNGIYKGNEKAHQRIAELVEGYIKERIAKDDTARLKILELGSGTTKLSQQLIDIVGKYQNHASYLFTNNAIRLIQKGKKELEKDHPFVEFKTLDLGKSPVLQGIPAQAIDLIIADNVMSSTTDINRTLQHVKQMLQPNGVILFNEITQPQLYATLIFGLTPVWWNFQDESYRIKNTPLLRPAMWRTVLENNGYKKIRVTGYLPVREDENQESLFLAESDGEIEVIEQFTTDSLQHGRASDTEELKSRASKGGDPTNALEENIATIWREVLETDTVGIHDEFSDLGGDSILATQITSRLEKIYPIKVDLKNIFEASTIATMAKIVERELIMALKEMPDDVTL